MVRKASVFASLLLALLGSCAPAADDGSGLAMRVRWSLTDPAQSLPAGIELLEFEAQYEGAPEGGVPWGSTVANLEDSDGNGRVEDVSPPLPTGIPITIRITGIAGGAPLYVGHIGPVVLQAGERRYVEPAMFRIGASTAVPAGGMRGRILHTSTALPDGRVLIAGGFSSVRRTTCPDELPMGARCFDLDASDEAYVYDPSEARFYAVQGGMLEARGGHTATALPDGRVLLAGGATHALLAMLPQGSAEAPTGFGIAILPVDADGESTALATFELFDPEANEELEDVDADGDPGRGGMVGAADAPDVPGRLDVARFLATASPVPGTGRVVIAGGSGSPTSMQTFTVFDAARAGGYGVLAGATPALVAPRVAAGSVSVGSGSSASVWIVGGTDATDDTQIAEVWSATAANPSGSTVSAAEEPRLFPQQMAGMPASHPDWSLTLPLVAPIGTAGHIGVFGWYGPFCLPGDESPMFPDGVSPVERCGFARRSFTIDTSTGLAQPTVTSQPHAFGAIAALEDGRVVVTGGIATLVWNVTNSIDVLTGTIGADGAAVVSPTPLALAEARAMHTTTPLPNGGALTVGGMRFDPGVTNIALLAPEVVYLERR